MKHYFSESKLPEQDKTRLHKQTGFIFQVASNISGHIELWTAHPLSCIAVSRAQAGMVLRTSHPCIQSRQHIGQQALPEVAALFRAGQGEEVAAAEGADVFLQRFEVEQFLHEDEAVVEVGLVADKD